MLAVPVALLECGNETMNGHLGRAIKADEPPFVRYEHESHTVSPSGAVRLKGTLAMAGTTRPIPLNATATAQPDGPVRVRGSEQLKMTDLGIKPPSLKFGTPSVHGPVVHYDLSFRPC